MIETVINILLSINDKRYEGQLHAIELADNAFNPWSHITSDENGNPIWGE